MTKALITAVAFTAAALGMAASAQEYRITEARVDGCMVLASLQEAVKILAQGDVRGYMAAITRGIEAGTCTWFAEGERVFLMDRFGSRSGGYVQVRRAGSPDSFWIIGAWVERAKSTSEQ